MTEATTKDLDGLDQVQSLMQAGQIPDALAALDLLQEDDRQSQMGLYMRAVCLRHLREKNRRRKNAAFLD